MLVGEDPANSSSDRNGSSSVSDSSDSWSGVVLGASLWEENFGLYFQRIFITPTVQGLLGLGLGLMAESEEAVEKFRA